MSDSNQVQQETLTELREVKERVSDIETILSELKVMIEELTAGSRDEPLVDRDESSTDDSLSILVVDDEEHVRT